MDSLARPPSPSSEMDGKGLDGEMRWSWSKLMRLFTDTDVACWSLHPIWSSRRGH